ncbi:hypothetical protein [Cyanobium sp. ULC084]|nr:MAG: hypothetical protein DCF24_01235 [Cyanobium sp.]
MKRFFCLLTVLILFPSPEALATGTETLPQVEGLTQDGPQLLLARERGSGRRAGGGGGGGRSGGRTGLGRQRASVQRSNRRPSGGWSNRVGGGDSARRSFNKSRLDRSQISKVDRGNWNGTRDRVNRIDRDQVRRRFENVNRSKVRERFNRIDSKDWDTALNRMDDGWDRVDRKDWDRGRDRMEERWDRVDSRLDNRWDRVDRTVDRINDWDNRWPGWVRPGWGVARPWRSGWYGGWRNPPWGWWGARSAAWGVRSLATAAVINNSVNEAIAASSTTILVPQSDYSLYYNSVQPSTDQQLTFVARNGETPLEMSADCKIGLLNDQEPSTESQAQLLNSACQVAFGEA